MTEPLGWTTLQLNQGNSTVHDNLLENCGRYDKTAAGEIRWADGISIFGSANVYNNIVINPTDVGIVIFGPDTVVTGNHIISSGPSAYLMGGIAMTDCTSSGDYSNVEVSNNLIEPSSLGGIGMAINAGPTNWRCRICRDDQPLVEEFDFTNSYWQGNTLIGVGFKYGFVISMVHGLETRGNDFSQAAFSGPPIGCTNPYHPVPANAGALVATEDVDRNELGETACEDGCFWNTSYSRDFFYRLR